MSEWVGVCVWVSECVSECVCVMVRVYVWVLHLHMSSTCLDIALCCSFEERTFGHLKYWPACRYRWIKMLHARDCRFADHTSMSLKTSALASHQTLFVFTWTYILVHKSQKIRTAISTHRKCFPEDYNCGLCCTCIVSHQIRTRLLANSNLYLIWTMRMECDHFRHTFELTGA